MIHTVNRTVSALARWKRGGDLEARYGLGRGCPPTMTEEEMKAWDEREERGENIGQHDLPDEEKSL